jgi:hypothetical protein
MEHRWGKRLAVDIPVRLSLPLLSAKRGRLTNVSLSGGFITTLVDVRILCRMLVAFEGPWLAQHDAVTVAAYVARRDENGFGVEWCEFAPAVVVELVKNASQTHFPLSGRRDASLSALRVAGAGELLKHGS